MGRIRERVERAEKRKAKGEEMSSEYNTLRYGPLTVPDSDSTRSVEDVLHFRDDLNPDELRAVLLNIIERMERLAARLKTTT